MILFFFSSRRRHTRSKRDWSSDVCSSDLLEAARKASVERVIYGSTTWVYSDCAEGEVDEDTVIAAPSHLYTATKLAGEDRKASCRERVQMPEVAGALRRKRKRACRYSMWN